jgi:hypothetical protein
MYIERNLRELQIPPSIQDLNNLKMEVLFILSVSPLHSSKLFIETIKTLEKYGVYVC